MALLRDVAQYVRSKNAGPFWVTLEIFCGNTEAYEKIKLSENISMDNIARLYKVNAEDIQEFYLPSINVIKYSFPRPFPSGYRYENDMHYGQQYRIIEETDV